MVKFTKDNLDESLDWSAKELMAASPDMSYSQARQRIAQKWLELIEPPLAGMVESFKKENQHV